MFPTKFDYHRPGSIQEAIQLLQANPDAKILAGGHSLIPVMKLRLAAPTALIDIGRIGEMKGIQRNNGSLTIGATTTYYELTNSSDVQDGAPLLAEAAGQIGDRQVRYRGTIGGNLSHADPASDLPAVALALDARLRISGPGGTRTVDAADFFVDLMTTSLAVDEILTAIEVPVGPGASGASYVKFEHPASGYALCGAAAVINMDRGDVCRSARLCLNGVSIKAVDAAAVGDALVGSDLSDAVIEQAVNEHLSIPEPMGDMFASEGYRQELAKICGIRALKQARDRARG